MFREAHWNAIAAVDLFSVEAWTLQGLTRLHIYGFIDFKTRRIRIAGTSGESTGEWVTRVTRSLIDGLDSLLHRYLIHDRDPLFGGALPALLRSAAVGPLCCRPPARARTPTPSASCARSRPIASPRSIPSASGTYGMQAQLLRGHVTRFVLEMPFCLDHRVFGDDVV